MLIVAKVFMRNAIPASRVVISKSHIRLFIRVRMSGICSRRETIEYVKNECQKHYCLHSYAPTLHLVPHAANALRQDSTHNHFRTDRQGLSGLCDHYTDSRRLCRACQPPCNAVSCFQQPPFFSAGSPRGNTWAYTIDAEMGITSGVNYQSARASPPLATR